MGEKCRQIYLYFRHELKKTIKRTFVLTSSKLYNVKQEQNEQFHIIASNTMVFLMTSKEIQVNQFAQFT